MMDICKADDSVFKATDEGKEIKELCFSTAVAVVASMLEKIEEILVTSGDITRDQVTRDRLSILLSEVKEVRMHTVNLAEVTILRVKMDVVRQER